MDSMIRPSYRIKTLLTSAAICVLAAAVVFVLHSLNATPAAAQALPCTQVLDVRDIPSPKILTFDNLPDGTPLNTQYQTGYGVFFPNQNPPPMIHAVSVNETDTAKTPPNVVRNTVPVGVPKAPLLIGFTFPRTYVGMYLGNGMLDTGGLVTAVFTAMDASGAPICSFRIPNVSQAHNTFAGVYDAMGRIATISIDYGVPTQAESMDNLYLTPGFNSSGRKPLPRWTPLPTPQPTQGPAPTATPVLPAFPLQYYNVPKNPILFTIKPDFSIFNIEITQGIQCFNGQPSGCSDDSLPLVLNKSTVARIYIHANDVHSFYNNVPVRLHILAYGKEYLVDATGKSTSSINQAAHDSADIYFSAYGSDTTIQFWAEVDPNHIYNSSYSNPRYPIVGNIVMSFSNRRTMMVGGQRLNYHPSGYTGTNLAGGWAVNGGAAQWWNQVLPLGDNAINYFVRSGYLDWTTNLGTGDGQHALIQALNFLWIQENALSWWFGTGPFTGARHIYGWAPAQGYSGGHADMPIYPHAGGLGVVGIGSDAPGTSTDNPGSGALIFGHELTHDYNIKHTNTPDACGSNDSSSSFPYPNSSIQAFGFNTITGKIYDPALTHDLMSYCPSGGSKQGWIAPYTWNTMFGSLTPFASLAIPVKGPVQGNTVPAGTLVQTAFTQSLVVNATLDNPNGNPTVTGHFGQLERITSGLAYTVASGLYAIEERDGNGALLFSQSFNVDFTSEYNSKGGALPPPPFPATATGAETISFVMPFADGTRTINLVYNPVQQPQQILDTRAVSLNAPQVTITSPIDAVDWPAKTTQVLTWTGTSLDKLPLTYSVFYSNDGGMGWVILASGLTTPSFNVIVDAMAGGSDVRFRVVASDGVNTGFDETPATITIPNHPPVPIISDPVGGSIHLPGDLVVFTGAASDMEDGTLPPAALVWSDDVQGGLGIGPTVPINSLLPGKHTITLTATDSYGASSSTSVSILVAYPVYMPTIKK
jgi:hypothetical protein